MKWSLLKVIPSVTSCALLASEQGGVDRAGLSTCLFFFFFHCIVAGVDLKKKKEQNNNSSHLLHAPWCRHP